MSELRSPTSCDAKMTLTADASRGRHLGRALGGLVWHPAGGSFLARGRIPAFCSGGWCEGKSVSDRHWPNQSLNRSAADEAVAIGKLGRCRARLAWSLGFDRSSVAGPMKKGALRAFCFEKDDTLEYATNLDIMGVEITLTTDSSRSLSRHRGGAVSIGAAGRVGGLVRHQADGSSPSREIERSGFEVGAGTLGGTISQSVA
ncbi:MAG: hypothetical protein ACRER2_17915 [Methylococcales bacterium]